MLSGVDSEGGTARTRRCGRATEFDVNAVAKIDGAGLLQEL